MSSGSCSAGNGNAGDSIHLLNVGLGFSSPSIDPFLVVAMSHALQLIATTQAGRLWHTIRPDRATWQPAFGDVKGAESNDHGYFASIGCAVVG